MALRLPLGNQYRRGDGIKLELVNRTGGPLSVGRIDGGLVPVFSIANEKGLLIFAPEPLPEFQSVIADQGRHTWTWQTNTLKDLPDGIYTATVRGTRWNGQPFISRAAFRVLERAVPQPAILLTPAQPVFRSAEPITFCMIQETPGNIHFAPGTEFSLTKGGTEVFRGFASDLRVIQTPSGAGRGGVGTIRWTPPKPVAAGQYEFRTLITLRTGATTSTVEARTGFHVSEGLNKLWVYTRLVEHVQGETIEVTVLNMTRHDIVTLAPVLKLERTEPKKVLATRETGSISLAPRGGFFKTTFESGALEPSWDDRDLEYRVSLEYTTRRRDGSGTSQPAQEEHYNIEIKERDE